MTPNKQKIIITKELQTILENGLAFHRLGNFEEAKRKYEFVLETYPNNYDALHLLGTIYYQLDKYDEAITLITKAIKLYQKSSLFYNNRGLAFQKTYALDKASLDFKKAIKLNPSNVEAYNNYAMVLKDLYLWENAILFINKAITLDRDNIVLYVTKGIILRELGLLEESLATLNIALSIDKEYPDALFAKSLTLIKSGNLKEGWRLYEHRWRSKSHTSPYLKSNKPQWDGIKHQKSILLWKEQGIGDEIMLSSLITNLSKYCNKLYVITEERLISLFERSFSKDISFLSHNESFDTLEYDAHIPIFSLPLHFKNNNKDYAQKFLFADKNKTKNIKEQIPAEDNKKICGISWKSGSIATGNDRTIDLHSFIKSLDTENLVLVNLQYGDVSEEIHDVMNKLGVIIHQIKSVDNFKDLDGLASLIESCNLVISTDSATIHLSGALGVETHLLLPYNSSFRWQIENKSIWYDSLNIYSQKRDLKWSSLFQQINNNIR